MSSEESKAPGTVIVSGERFVVGDGPQSAWASARLYWFGQYIERTAAGREHYAGYAARPGFWLHADADAAREAMRAQLANEVAEYGNTRGWNPDVWRVRLELEAVAHTYLADPAAADRPVGCPAVVLAGQRFVVGEDPSMAMAGVFVQWLMPVIAHDRKDREDYARLSSLDRLVFADAREAFEDAARRRNANQGASGWEPRVFRVLVEIEQVSEVDR